MSVLTPTPSVVYRARVRSEAESHALEHALALGQRLLGAVDAFALQFESDGLGDLDLPPTLAPAADQAQLRTVAPLYLASELEAARLLPIVETLAGVAISGGAPVELGDAATLLFQFWEGRHTRFTATERQAFFSRLFGTGGGPTLAVQANPNSAFEPLLIDLAEALYKLDPGVTLRNQYRAQIPLRMAAQRLAANLIPRSGGMAAYAARDLLRTMSEALAILKQMALQHALGERSAWGVLRNLAGRYEQEEIDVSAHVTRGKAGMALLAWLAEVSAYLEDSGAELVSPDHQVVAEAGAWLEASLALVEAPQRSARQRG